MKPLATSVIAVWLLLWPFAADAGPNNHVQIREQLYFSLMDDSSDYGLSGEGLVDDQVSALRIY